MKTLISFIVGLIVAAAAIRASIRGLAEWGFWLPSYSFWLIIPAGAIGLGLLGGIGYGGMAKLLKIEASMLLGLLLGLIAGIGSYYARYYVSGIEGTFMEFIRFLATNTSIGKAGSTVETDVAGWMGRGLLVIELIGFMIGGLIATVFFDKDEEEVVETNSTE